MHELLDVSVLGHVLKLHLTFTLHSVNHWNPIKNQQSWFCAGAFPTRNIYIGQRILTTCFIKDLRPLRYANWAVTSQENSHWGNWRPHQKLIQVNSVSTLNFHIKLILFGFWYLSFKPINQLMKKSLRWKQTADKALVESVQENTYNQILNSERMLPGSFWTFIFQKEGIKKFGGTGIGTICSA